MIFISIIRIHLQGHIVFMASYVVFPLMVMLKSFLYQTNICNSLFKEKY